MSYYKQYKINERTGKWKCRLVKIFGRKLSIKEDDVYVGIYYFFGAYYITEVKNPGKKDLTIQLD